MTTEQLPVVRLSDTACELQGEITCRDAGVPLCQGCRLARNLRRVVTPAKPFREKGWLERWFGIRL